MAIKEVLLLGNPKLRKKSEEVTDFGDKLQNIIQNLKDTLIHLQERKNIGRALAAPQLGYMKKVVYANLPEEEIIMINPEVIWRSEELFEVWDSCFSFDISFFVQVRRHRSIKVKYQNEKGEKIIRRFNDDLSELFQHEIDHLYGILATDHVISNKKIIMRKEWEKRYK